jgi:hypothetical protein
MIAPSPFPRPAAAPVHNSTRCRCVRGAAYHSDTPSKAGRDAWSQTIAPPLPHDLSPHPRPAPPRPCPLSAPDDGRNGATAVRSTPLPPPSPHTAPASSRWPPSPMPTPPPPSPPPRSRPPVSHAPCSQPPPPPPHPHPLALPAASYATPVGSANPPPPPMPAPACMDHALAPAQHQAAGSSPASAPPRSAPAATKHVGLPPPTVSNSVCPESAGATGHACPVALRQPPAQCHRPPPPSPRACGACARARTAPPQDPAASPAPARRQWAPPPRQRTAAEARATLLSLRPAPC